MLQGSFYFNIRHILSQLLNPALCLACGIPIASTDFICSHCLQALTRVKNPCSSCGLPNKADGKTCPACLHNPPRWQHMISPLVYQGSSRKFIHELKFNEQIHHVNALLTHIYSSYSHHPVDVLLPVPLHKTRLLERGFNQSEEITNTLSRLLNIPVDRTSLKRIKATQSQSGLSLNKRQQNILKAFEFVPTRQYNSIAIIDDVITTGSTMSEITKVLKRSKVKHVEVWSLARALKHD